MQWAQSCWDQCSGVMVGAWCPVVLHTMGSCAPQTAAAELAGNNRCCLSQSLMSEVYIIASLIFLEGCIESYGYRAARQIDWVSADVNEID